MKQIVVTISAILLIIGCNPAKRLQKQQRAYQQLVDAYIKEHPPRIDTVTTFIKGADSSAYFKQMADSLATLKPAATSAVAIKYRDTCKSAVYRWDEGYEYGYKIGFVDGKANAPGRVDTVKDSFYPTDLINALEKENHTLQLLLQAEKTKTVTIRSQKKDWFWFFVVSAIINMLLIFALFKKLKNDSR